MSRGSSIIRMRGTGRGRGRGKKKERKNNPEIEEDNRTKKVFHRKSKFARGQTS